MQRELPARRLRRLGLDHGPRGDRPAPATAASGGSRRRGSAGLRGIAAEALPRRLLRPPAGLRHGAPPGTAQTVGRGPRLLRRRSRSNLDAGRGLWLMGDIGTGKTTLAMLVSKAALEAGRSVAIYSMPRPARPDPPHLRRRRAARSRYSQFFQRLASVDLLHLDDLGAEQPHRLGARAALRDRRPALQGAALDGRHDEPRGAALEEQIGARTVSRLVEMCDGDPLPLLRRRPALPDDTAPPSPGPTPPATLIIPPLCREW